jgi:hypothetical protein
MTGDGHLSGAANDGTATRESARNIRVRAGPEIRRLSMCAARNACRCILQREGATLRGPRSSAAGGCRRRDPQRPPSSTSRTRGTRSTRGQAAARSAAPLTDETNEDVRDEVESAITSDRVDEYRHRQIQRNASANTRDHAGVPQPSPRSTPPISKGTIPMTRLGDDILGRTIPTLRLGQQISLSMPRPDVSPIIHRSV